MKAVRFDEYGGVDVLEVREVEDPVAGPGEVLVAVKAAGINPGEIAIREGRLHERWPATFPSGEGTDLAGVVRARGRGRERVRCRRRGARLDRAARQPCRARRGRPADQLTAKPTSVRVGGRGVIVRRWVRRLRVGSGGRPAGRRDGRGLGRGGRRGLGRCPARAPHRSNRDRAGQRAQPRLAAPPRRRAGDLRRRAGRADPRSRRRQARRVHRHVRRRLRRPGDRAWASLRSGSTRSPTSRRCSDSASTGRARTRSPPRRCSHSSSALVADGSLEIPIARTYPAGPGSRRLPRAGRPPQPRQDRAAALRRAPQPPGWPAAGALAQTIPRKAQ